MPINKTTLVGSAGLFAEFGTAAICQPAAAISQPAPAHLEPLSPDGADARPRASSPRCSRKYPRAIDRLVQRTREPARC